MKIQIFHHAKNITLKKKKSSKRKPKSFEIIITLLISFQVSTQVKISSFKKKSSNKNRPNIIT
jgi:hypothetical protein